MGLFSYDLQKEILIQLWDLVYVCGLNSLKWFIVSLFQVLKELILSLNGDQLNETLKNNLKTTITDEIGRKIIEETKKLLIEEKYCVQKSLVELISLED